MVDAVGKEVPKLLVSPDTNDSVKQCAALCVLKLFRLKTDILPPGEWTSRIVQLLNDKHLVGTVRQICRSLHNFSINCQEKFIVIVNSICNASPDVSCFSYVIQKSSCLLCSNGDNYKRCLLFGMFDLVALGCGDLCCQSYSWCRPLLCWWLQGVCSASSLQT